MFSNFSDLIEKLASTNGRIEKENYLREYADDQDVKKLLHFQYNPYFITGISKKKLSKFKDEIFSIIGLETFSTVDEFLQYLKEHKSGRDIDVMTIVHFARSLPQYSDLIFKFVMKDIKVGVSATTLNKIFGKGFVPVFDVMLGDRYFDNPDKYLPYGTDFILTQKLDGVRCVCIRELDGTTQFFSRQGQPILDLIDIEEEMKNLPVDYVYDGELLLVNDNNLDSKDLYRATVKVTSSDSIKRNVIFNAFDILPLKDFRQGFCAINAYARKTLLNNFISRKPLRWVKNVDVLYTGSDKDKVGEWLNKITSEGGEGVMINLFNSPYECKRSRGLLKVKKMQTCDIKCIDVVEGTGQNANKLGAAVCEFKGPDGKIYRVNVGSGFTLKDREDIWAHPSLIVGKIIEVQYFEITQNEQGGYSLRFPVYLSVRNDKDEISMY